MKEHSEGEPARGRNWYPWLHWLPLLAYSGLIFYFSSLSEPILPTDRLKHSDKALHFAAYAAWALFCSWGLWRTWWRLGGLQIGLITFFGAVFYGLSDEIHQSFVPGRVASLYDLLADSLGGLAGMAVASWFRARGIRRRTE